MKNIKFLGESLKNTNRIYVSNLELITEEDFWMRKE